MDPKKLEMIEEILEHLSGHQAKALKDILDKSRAPKEMPMEGEKGEGMPKVMGVEVDVEKPKHPMDKMVDDSIEGNMDKKEPGDMGGEKEMSDEELEELMKHLV